MYKKMLVPLDGSELAECVLPHVKAIATGCNVAAVVLLQVVEPPPARGTEGIIDYGDWQDANMKIAREYLARVQSQLILEGLKVESQVLEGMAAEAVATFAKGSGVDLIAIATHGRSGISRWVFGSVADRVLRSSGVPVLMVRPAQCELRT
jgi:nucleotide-binding universal stress UspA family protein